MSEEVSGDMSKKVVALLLVLAIVLAAVGTYKVINMAKAPVAPSTATGQASLTVAGTSDQEAAEQAAKEAERVKTVKGGAALVVQP